MQDAVAFRLFEVCTINQPATGLDLYPGPQLHGHFSKCMFKKIKKNTSITETHMLCQEVAMKVMKSMCGENKNKSRRINMTCSC